MLVSVLLNLLWITFHSNLFVSYENTCFSALVAHNKSLVEINFVQSNKCGGVVFRIKFKPNRRVSRTFVGIFGKNPVTIKKAMNQSKSSIASYWYTNIYKYFNARESAGLSNTKQLGQSLRIAIDGIKLSLSMIAIHNARTQFVKFDFPRMPTMSGALSFTPFSMPSMGMGRTYDLDYGKLMRDGFKPCSAGGHYDYTKDRKVKPGSHPGYDRNTRWVPWMKDFYVKSQDILADFMCKELKKIGINGRKPQWRVDIQI